MAFFIALSLLGSPLQQRKSETEMFADASKADPNEPKVWRLRPRGGDFRLDIAWPAENVTLRVSGVFDAGRAFHSKLDLSAADAQVEFVQIRASEHSTMHVVLCPNGADQRNAHVLAVLGGATHATVHLPDRKPLAFTEDHLKQVRQLANQVFRVLSEQGGLAPSQRPYMANSIVSPGRPADMGPIESIGRLMP